VILRFNARLFAVAGDCTLAEVVGGLLVSDGVKVV